MNIQEFEAIVNQTLGLEGVTEEKLERLEIVKKDEKGNVVTNVIYWLDGDGYDDWFFETNLKIRKNDAAVIKGNHSATGLDLKDDEYLLVRLHGTGRTLKEAVQHTLFSPNPRPIGSIPRRSDLTQGYNRTLAMKQMSTSLLVLTAFLYAVFGWKWFTILSAFLAFHNLLALFFGAMYAVYLKTPWSRRSRNQRG